MNSNPITSILLVCCSFFWFLLSGCSIHGQLMPEINRTTPLLDSEVIIMGRIQLKPALQKEEQNLNPPGVLDFLTSAALNRNRAIVHFNTKPIDRNPVVHINPPLETYFFYKIPRNTSFMVSGFIMTDYERRSKIHLPVWFELDIHPSNKAIYIGDLVYTRDDFNSIIDFELKDRYQHAATHFKRTFGSKLSLHRSLVEPMEEVMAENIMSVPTFP